MPTPPRTLSPKIHDKIKLIAEGSYTHAWLQARGQGLDLATCHSLAREAREERRRELYSMHPVS